MLLFVSCAEQTPQQDATAQHFTYEQQNRWTHVAGQMQSPINIISHDVVALDTERENGAIEVAYDETALNIVNNGHSIEVTSRGWVKINGRSFELRQFHFHAQSEHTINGTPYPLEAHFVHEGQDGRLAVIAVFFEVGNKNEGFETVLRNIDKNHGPITLNTHGMMPENKSYYHYLGSLTTPPLTENVEWYVLKTPVSIAEEQLSVFKTLYNHNNRELQPLNERKVVSFDS